MLKRTKWRWKGLPTGRQSPRGWLNHSGAILPVGTDLGGSSGGVARLTRPCDPFLYVIPSRRAQISSDTAASVRKRKPQPKPCSCWISGGFAMVLRVAWEVEASWRTNFKNVGVVTLSIGWAGVGVFEGGTDLLSNTR
ncbi:uncharacterized protein PODANS_6_1200 [Podospora anserina S mat+]|uniref:Podospora anserina S mat+ genomic DNA chromosome 6, supercontig 2 n=1 Tax=Podospora anserina (strain S / ATCC MYA-4624 / DSM 980 / FGSC 10383) TaxID=515849 RepID=B2B336_PODAN|nr:uncharacterized protein PODANS_6_1200 [Podospora anserina S mat+]CAP71522.1 unnamed protein product [Podospora anserina S mat+]CDP30918.1 Putative protein of unknown function [Podospora anserina S mat+]